ncbi:hypothetical protein PSPO01_00908 [Paraphaeosphaeria sporulosa]
MPARSLCVLREIHGPEVQGCCTQLYGDRSEEAQLSFWRSDKRFLRWHCDRLARMTTCCGNVRVQRSYEHGIRDCHTNLGGGPGGLVSGNSRSWAPRTRSRWQLCITDLGHRQWVPVSSRR